jgi:5-methylcytosine-specific restriction endonuclease McrA
MASLTSMTKNEVNQKYNINSKQIIEKEITHLKNVLITSYGISKIQYEQIIKNKEEELQNCEKWLNSKEGIELKIKDIEKTIKYRKLVLDQKHPMTTSEDIKSMTDLLHKYEEELQIYINKLKDFEDRLMVKKPKETKVKEPKPLKEPKIKEEKPSKEVKVKEPKQPKEAKIKEVKPPKEDKPKKKKPIPAAIKKLVWNTNIGEEIGKAKCVCCKSTDITQISFNCGHVISEHNGGETIVSNLKPICQNCNSSMGTKNMNDFMLSFM